MVNTKKIKGRDIEVIKSKIPNIPTPQDLPNLHGVFLAIARRNSGKSLAQTNLIKMYQRAGCIQRVLLITPTYYSNKHYWDDLGIAEEDVYHQPNDASLKAVVKEVEGEQELWEQYQHDKKEFQEVMKALKQNNFQLSDDVVLKYINSETGEISPPQYKYGDKKPTIAVIIDDAMSTPLMRAASPLTNLVVKHRHIARGLGLSLFFAVQSFRTHNGIAKAIRGNCTVLMIFKTQNHNEIQAIMEEVAGEIPPDKFLEAYEYATKEPHSFLMVELPKKKGNPSAMRKNFNEWIF